MEQSANHAKFDIVSDLGFMQFSRYDYCHIFGLIFSILLLLRTKFTKSQYIMIYGRIFGFHRCYVMLVR